MAKLMTTHEPSSRVQGVQEAWWGSNPQDKNPKLCHKGIHTVLGSWGLAFRVLSLGFNVLGVRAWDLKLLVHGGGGA